MEHVIKFNVKNSYMEKTFFKHFQRWEPQRSHPVSLAWNWSPNPSCSNLWLFLFFLFFSPEKYLIYIFLLSDITDWLLWGFFCHSRFLSLLIFNTIMVIFLCSFPQTERRIHMVLYTWHISLDLMPWLTMEKMPVVVSFFHTILV